MSSCCLVFSLIFSIPAVWSASTLIDRKLQTRIVNWIRTSNTSLRLQTWSAEIFNHSMNQIVANLYPSTFCFLRILTSSKKLIEWRRRHMIQRMTCHQLLQRKHLPSQVKLLELLILLGFLLQLCTFYTSFLWLLLD